MIDFLIIYELRQRELENIVLVGTELKKRGYTVEYCNFPFPVHKIQEIRNKYYGNVRTILTQSMYDSKVLYNLVYRIAGPVSKIVNLQWEQVGTVRTEADINSYRYPRGIAKEILHICWGDTPRHNLIRVGVNPEKAVITGPLHMDFLRLLFNKFYRSKNEVFLTYGLNPSLKTIFFISSFSYASLSKKDINNLKRKAGDTIVEEHYRLSVNSQKLFFGWVEKLLNEEPLINFIYRPHPAEKNIEKLITLERTYSNFKVIRDYSVKQWIIICDKLYTWYSTSIVEAYFAHVPCAIIRPIPIAKDEDVSIMIEADVIDNYEAFRESVSKNYEFPIKPEVIEKYYHVDKNIPSYIRLANLLETVINSNQYDIFWETEIIREMEDKAKSQKWANRLYRIYSAVISFCSIINDKLDIRFSHSISKRIEKQRFAKEKRPLNDASGAEIQELELKIQNYITCI